MNAVLSVDWLSYYGYFVPKKSYPSFELKKREYGTRVYSVIEDVVYKGKIFATICRCPYSKILADNSAILKFENFTLYDSQFCDFREFLIKSLEFEIKCISRLDIALDFNYFENGLNGHQLISKFLKSEYLHNGRGKFAVNGTQKFDVSFEYLRLGSGKSNARVYLYNKTQELADVKDKPYIREKWAKHKLNVEIPVWRLELSLGSQAFEWYDTETGERGLEFDYDFRDAERLQILYQNMINKLFCFKKNDGTKNKSRMQSLNLVNLSKVKWENVKTQSINENGRRERILLRNLYKFVERFGNGDENLETYAEELRVHLIKTHGMAEYFERKKEIWKREN